MHASARPAAALGRDAALLALASASAAAKKAAAAAVAKAGGNTPPELPGSVQDLIGTFAWSVHADTGFPVPGAVLAGRTVPRLAGVLRDLATASGADGGTVPPGSWCTCDVESLYEGDEGDLELMLGKSDPAWLLPVRGGAAAEGQPAAAANPFGASHATHAYVPTAAPLHPAGEEDVEVLPAAAAADTVLFAQTT